MTFWCEHAWLGGRVEHGVELGVERGRITTVDAGAPRSGTVLRGLTLPGMANAHSHAFQRAMRGRTHNRGGTFWTWREQMYALASRLDPDSYRGLATAAFAEMATAGYTCIGEFHYVHHGPGGRPYSDPNAMGAALLDAAEAAGVRITLLDTCYLHGGIGSEPNDVQRRFSDGRAEAWAERVAALACRPLARTGAAIHSVRAVDPASIEVVAAAAAGPLHAHVSEQPAENSACLDAYGCTPTELLATHGAIGPGFTAVHATHLTDADLGWLGSVTVCLCPTTERDLADGIGPSEALAGAGAGLCIGSDSHAVVDPFEEIRAIELDARLITGRRGVHAPADLLAGATATGYLSLGWGEGGRLACGALADFISVSLDSPRLAGADPADLVTAAVFAATSSDVNTVVVGGEVVVSGGRHRRIDVTGELDRAIGALWA